MKRRKFLSQTAGIGAGLYLASAVPGFATAPRKLDAIGLQLYTVNDAMGRDF